MGRLISSKDPLNRITSYFYDDLDRLTKVVGADPDGVVGGDTTDKIPSESRTYYDAAGNVAMTQSRQKPDPLTAATGTSSLGIFSTTINRYDRLDRLTSTIDANGGVTQFRYDNGGNRIQLTDASFNTTRWQYDAQGQVLSETDPNRLSIVNEYDLVGNIFAVTDRRGYRTQFVGIAGAMYLVEDGDAVWGDLAVWENRGRRLRATAESRSSVTTTVAIAYS